MKLFVNINSKIRSSGTRARAPAPARPRERERLAIRAVEQNDYGRIGSLFRRASPLIEHETSELVRQVFGENLFTIFSGLLTESFLEV